MPRNPFIMEGPFFHFPLFSKTHMAEVTEEDMLQYASEDGAVSEGERNGVWGRRRRWRSGESENKEEGEKERE